MKFTKDMIEDPKKHCKFNARGPDYWRHVVKPWNEDEKLSVDFVRKPRVRGWRVNIRVLNRRAATWNGYYMVRWNWQTSTCWIQPNGTVEDIKDSKNNDRQKDGSELEDWRDYMPAIWEALQ